jgi:hypothetical protein
MPAEVYHDQYALYIHDRGGRQQTIFQCEVGVLEQKSLLRIHTRSISGRRAEERRIISREVLLEEMGSFDGALSARQRRRAS